MSRRVAPEGGRGRGGRGGGGGRGGRGGYNHSDRQAEPMAARPDPVTIPPPPPVPGFGFMNLPGMPQFR